MGESRKVGYRYNAVDIHSHILPGVDFGEKDTEGSLELLAAARAEGIRDVIATPHYGKQIGFAPRADAVRAAFEEIRKTKEQKTKALHGLRLYLGEQVYCSGNAAEEFRSGKALRLNNTRYALVDFLEFGVFHEDGKDILERLEKLVKSKAVSPILAHAERYTALQKDRDSLKRIQDMGVLIQVNAFDLALNKNRQTRETAQWLAEERMISFIGSDMNNRFPARMPKMREGIDWLYEHTDEEYADRVVRKNAEKYLKVKSYDPWVDMMTSGRRV